MGRCPSICVAAALAIALVSAPGARAQSGDGGTTMDTAIGGIVGGMIGTAIKRPSATHEAAPQRTRPSTADRDTVRQDQIDLNALGFSTGRPDGAAGPMTRRAFTEFQAAVGLPETGIVTAQERLVLRTAAARLAAGDNRDFALGYAAARVPTRSARSTRSSGGRQPATSDRGTGAFAAGLVAGVATAARSGGTTTTAVRPVTVTAPAPAPTTVPAPVTAPQTAAVAPASGPAIPSRRFSGPGQYPPTDYRGYGVLAFKSQQTSYDALRHQIICEAYLATMLPSRVIAAPKGDQFVTIWPVETVASADRLNASDAPLTPLCRSALEEVDLPTAAEAIRKARMAGFEDGGVGPFLLGWLPGDGFGSSDALILSLDLSLVASYAQAQALFTEWKRDIESDPALLERGLSLEVLRRKIRRWADRHGPGFLALWKG